MPSRLNDSSALATIASQKCRKGLLANHLKSVASRQAEKLIRDGLLYRMDDSLLSMAIRNARNISGRIGAPLAGEISYRLKKSVLTDTVIDRIFLEVDRDMIPDQLAHDMSNWLIKNPRKAMHLIVHGMAIGVFSGVTVEAFSIGLAFGSCASLNLKSGEVFTGSGAKPKKKLAEQHAISIAILKARRLPYAEQAVKCPEQQPTASKGIDGHPKGALLETCTKLKLKAPVFSVTRQGPSHKPLFFCEAKMSFDGQVITANSGWEPTRRESEAVASKAPQEQLLLARQALTPAKSLVASSNPVGDLQELMAKLGQVEPEYMCTVKSIEPPLFEAVVSFMSGTGMATAMGEGTSKAVAKKEAANKALQAL